ncbi:MAG: type II secretion system protein [Fimbriimonadaceae bacterium]
MKRTIFAFTVVELLVVTGIIALLAALISPSLHKAKHSAQISSSVSRLRQLHIAARIYLDDDPMATNRLTNEYVYSTYLGFGEAFFISPCGQKQNEFGQIYKGSYWYASEPNVPKTYFEQYRENAIQFADTDCDPEGSWDSPIALKRALAVTDGGQIINKVRYGNPHRIEWWMSLTTP